MTVELISVGTEILLGNIVNTNAAYLSEQCAQKGLSCYYQVTIGDNAQRLKAVLETALTRSDIVILSGGLGPTQDDLTKEVAAAVMKKELVPDDHSRERIKEYFESRKLIPSENNWKQALMPEGAVVIDNANGTAPGVIIEENGKIIILLPGPPNELIPMFENDIVPYLDQKTDGVILSRTVKLCDIGESTAETMIMDMLENQSNPTIAPYAKTGEVHLRVTAKGKDAKEAKQLLKPVVNELKSRFDGKVYSAQDEVTLERAVVELLSNNRLTVTTAESCTGGLFTARLVNVSGVSEVLKSGYITYSNKAKRKILKVKRATLQKYGAVSKQVAVEMAQGAALAAKADVAVAITGIAGPEGGTDEKPVGLVYIACVVKGNPVVKEYRFLGNRNKIRESTVSAALTLLRQCILDSL